MKKRIVALALAALMLCGCLLAGCGKGGGLAASDQERIVGSWATQLDMAEVMNKAFDEEGLGDYMHLPSFGLTVNFTFEKDGTYRVAGDQASLEKSMEEARKILTDGLTKFAEDMIESSGLDMTVDELFGAMGMSIDDLMEEAFDTSALDLSSLSSQGKYALKDGKLFTVEKGDGFDESVYELYKFVSANEVVLTEHVGSDASELSPLFPLTLKRVG